MIVKRDAVENDEDLGSHLHLRTTLFYCDARGSSVPIDHVVVAIKE